jgi:type III secretion system FlhB-like substrate exporter
MICHHSGEPALSATAPIVIAHGDEKEAEKTMEAERKTGI